MHAIAYLYTNITLNSKRAMWPGFSLSVYTKMPQVFNCVNKSQNNNAWGIFDGYMT